MYAIARRFSLAARRTATAFEYLPPLSGSSRYSINANDWPIYLEHPPSCRCPLAIMLLTDLPKIRTVGHSLYAPTPETVADVLLPSDAYDCDNHGERSDYVNAWVTINGEAEEFAVDWDSGRIDDLAEALGLI